MDDIAANIIDRETALADFDHARDDFEQALSMVPEEAMGYLPEGDDYTIGDLVPHVMDVIVRYHEQLDIMEEAEYREVRIAAYPDEAARIKKRHKEHASMPANEERRGALAEMEAAHDRLAARLREMAYEQYARQAPVYYPGSDEVYPTRAADILGWLTDHYREHVVQTEQMLEQWKRGVKRDT